MNTIAAFPKLKIKQKLHVALIFLVYHYKRLDPSFPSKIRRLDPAVFVATSPIEG